LPLEAEKEEKADATKYAVRIVCQRPIFIAMFHRCGSWA